MKLIDREKVDTALRAMESVGYRFYWALHRDRPALAGKTMGLIVHDRILTGARGNVRIPH